MSLRPANEEAANATSISLDRRHPPRLRRVAVTRRWQVRGGLDESLRAPCPGLSQAHRRIDNIRRTRSQFLHRLQARGESPIER
jgi:hypothetical protein